MTKALATCLLFSVLSATTLPAFGGEAAGEEAAVRAAVLDYVEGVYDVDPARIERSVHPELAKRGIGLKFTS